LPGLEDGLLPLRPEMIFAGKYETRPADLAEERRLLYVGLTRAAKFVYCSHSASRKLFGKDFMLHPSPFLDNMRDLMRQSRLMRHIVARHESLSLLAGGLKLSNKHKK
jgi:superfamily I DNA/RNA helicase